MFFVGFTKHVKKKCSDSNELEVISYSINNEGHKFWPKFSMLCIVLNTVDIREYILSGIQVRSNKRGFMLESYIQHRNSNSLVLVTVQMVEMKAITPINESYS